MKFSLVSIGLMVLLATVVPAEEPWKRVLGKEAADDSGDAEWFAAWDRYLAGQEPDSAMEVFRKNPARSAYLRTQIFIFYKLDSLYRDDSREPTREEIDAWFPPIYENDWPEVVAFMKEIGESQPEVWLGKWALSKRLQMQPAYDRKGGPVDLRRFRKRALKMMWMSTSTALYFQKELTARKSRERKAAGEE